MLLAQTQPELKRKKLREHLQSGKLLKFPGAFSPLSALLIEKHGYDGIYISGSVLSNELGYPDIGLTTLTEVSQRARQISRVTALPSIVDADTGFGEPLNVARSIQEFIELGLSGCHLEDQMNPKRCGHLDGKNLISPQEMIRKIKIAADMKNRLAPDFLLIARTDARTTEGLDKAINRAKAYVDSGADMIFPEALQSHQEFEKFRQAISAPLLANMTEFGKSPILTFHELSNLGFNIVIYPVTLLRLSLKVWDSFLKGLQIEGSQQKWLSEMYTRQELYDLSGYEKYNRWDQEIYNFKPHNDMPSKEEK